MTMYGPFAGAGYGWGWRVRWRSASHRRGWRSLWLGARAHGPYRRKLAKIERNLMADTPTLSSKFDMFNHLTGGERPVGMERLSIPPLHRPQAMYLAALLALAAVATMCITLSAQVRTAVHACQAVALTGTSAQTPARGPTCNAYPKTK